MSDPKSKHARPLWQFFLALGICLAGVVSGTLFTLKFQGPRPWNRPTALGHEAPPPAGMVWIPGGDFLMGSNSGAQDERPAHRVRVNGFWMDAHEVTNEEFRRFVDATGYVTEAQQLPLSTGESARAAGSLVFVIGKGWAFVPGANWLHPEGPGSRLHGREKHPAVHISWRDAVSYAAWAGKRLPTEAEWEFAARSGLEGQRYVWGQEKAPGGKWMANVWQGPFPQKDSGEDGFQGTAPVGSFLPNRYHVFDLAGNVWEWCADWYSADYYRLSPATNPPGPDRSFDRSEMNVPKKVRRGGSYLSPAEGEEFFRPGARSKMAMGTAACDQGFRCVRDR